MTRGWIRRGGSIAVLLILAVVASASATSAHAVVGPRTLTRDAPAPFAATVTTVAVGKDPNFVMYDPANKDLFVANEKSASVSVISSSTNKVVATVTVGTEPLDMIYDPSSQDVYVLNFEVSLSVISSANKVVHTETFPAGVIPFTQIYDPADSDVYVVCDTSSGPVLERINPSTWALTSISLPAGALVYIAYDNASSSLVASAGSSNELAVVSTSNAVTLVKLPAGIWPAWMIYNPHDSDLYVTDIGETSKGFTKTGNVSVLSSANKITATVKVGEYPTIDWYDPGNYDMYQVNTGLPSGSTYPASTVSVISGTKVVKTLTVGKYAVVAQYDPKNGDMYVACPDSDATYPISKANALGAAIPTTQWATAAVYDPALGDMLATGEGTTTFLGTTGADIIVTLIPSTNTGTSTVTLELGPVAGGAYDPADSGYWFADSGSNAVSVIL